MKKHNSLKVVLITMVVLLLLTWILPAAVFQNGAFYDQGRVQMGLFDLFQYPTATLAYFGYVAIFVLVVGGFYGVLNKTTAYRDLLDKIATKFKGKEKYFIIAISILIAVITSFTGLSLGMFFLFPFVISVILLMGYDKIVAASTTVGSVMIGLIGLTFANGSTSSLALNSTLGIEPSSEIITKVILLALGLVLLLFNTIRHANKHKNEDVAAANEDYIPAKKEDGKKQKIWPLVVIIDLLLIVMILSFISWDSAFGVSIFESAKNGLESFKLFGFPLFAKLLGTVSVFGEWSYSDLITLIMIATCLVALIYRVKFNDVVDGFFKGVRKMAYPALVMILIYACLLLTTYHPFQLTIAKAVLGITKGFNVVTTAVVGFLSGIFNVDMLYQAQSTIPYLTSVVTDTARYPLIQIIYQTMYGFSMLVAPTSVILMGTLAYLKVPYQKWLKYIWKLLIELLVILFVVYTIVLLI